MGRHWELWVGFAIGVAVGLAFKSSVTTMIGVSCIPTFFGGVFSGRRLGVAKKTVSILRPLAILLAIGPTVGFLLGAGINSSGQRMFWIQASIGLCMIPIGGLLVSDFTRRLSLRGVKDRSATACDNGKNVERRTIDDNPYSAPKVRSTENKERRD